MDTDFRKIIKDAKNEQLAEENDKKRRACNLILHGVTESQNNEDVKELDEEYVKLFFRTLGWNKEHKSLYRLGKRVPNKIRPIKVVLTCEEEKDAIMANLNCLKGNEDFSKISVTEDYTIGDKDRMKEWTDRAKAKNTQEPPESNYEWKVKCMPKNGLLLKKFQKRIPTQQL